MVFCKNLTKMLDFSERRFRSFLFSFEYGMCLTYICKMPRSCFILKCSISVSEMNFIEQPRRHSDFFNAWRFLILALSFNKLVLYSNFQCTVWISNDFELLQDIKTWRLFGAQIHTHTFPWVKITGRKFWSPEQD